MHHSKHSSTARLGHQHHPRCLACGGSGYAEFPKALEAQVSVLLGNTGLEIKRTIYEGKIQVYNGHFIKFNNKHVPVEKINGRWVAQAPEHVEVPCQPT